MSIRKALFFLLLVGNTVLAQQFNAISFSHPDQKELNAKFKNYSLVSLDLNSLQSILNQRGNTHSFQINAETFNWDIVLSEFNMYKEDYFSAVGTDGKILKSTLKKFRTFNVINKSARGAISCFVTGDQYLYGYVQDGGIKRFIEPLSYYLPNCKPNEFLIYLETDVIPVEGVRCAADELEENKHRHQEEIVNNNRAGCVSIDIALSCDKTVHDKRGGVNQAEAWMFSILALVQTNYDNEFNVSIEFGVSATFVPTTSGSDPWNGINSIDGQLTTHRSWANGGGYGANYAVATNWTTKFTSGAIGLAYVGTMCGGSRYNVCSDFGGANGLLRCLQSHELGHNFNSGHDGGGGFIMSPSVSGTNVWSPNSINVINNYVNSIGCKGTCSGGEPPVADFSGIPEQVCPNGVVNFTDESSNTPTQWQWTFPGGTPSSSTLKNPSIVYKTTGVYDVTLKATNSFGNNTKTIQKYIEVLPLVVNSFSAFSIDRDLYTTNTSQNADFYEWKFGDGNTSNEEEPIHTYDKDGTYTVELCAYNTCGKVCKKITVNVFTPVEANFTAEVQEGCTSLKVQYRNQSSSNATTFAWSFPGGNPSVSTLKEPLVTYSIKGVFDAKLVASNPKFNSTKFEKSFIRVDSKPIAEFDHKAPLGKTIEFVNNTVDTIFPWKYKYEWNFGDSLTSTEKNPTHTFAKSGKFNVCLITDNSCAKDTVCKEVEISSLLNASFTVQNNKGCVPYIFDFKNTSTGATAFKWSFPGGIPNTSTDINPRIAYNIKGKYKVSLTAYSANDSTVIIQDSVINVNEKPTALFNQAVKQYTVKFNNQSLNGITYSWNFGDNSPVSNEQNPEHTYAREGEFDVELTVSNECGESKIKSKAIVYLIPKIDFGVNKSEICVGDLAQFIDQSSKDVNDWKWQIEGGTPSVSTDKNPISRFNKPGIYTIKLSVKNSNGENSIIKTGYIQVKSSVLCPKRGGKKNDVPWISTEGEEVVSSRIKNNYGDVYLYPNPSTGIFYLDFVDPILIDSKNFQIYNSNGIRINELHFRTLNKTRIEMDFSELSSGVYSLNILTKEGVLTKKFVILK
ncbi:MAG: PKD domain-containing protein [Saprospiraceae bacterium]|nr:PKD domain-containing protein [Saprospiraceae bacterium]